MPNRVVSLRSSARDRAKELQRRLAQAETAMESGDSAGARRECISVLAAAARAGDRPATIRALELLSHQCWWLGDMAACIDYGLRAIDRCHADAEWGRCISSLVLVSYALCELELGSRALRFAQSAHRLAQGDALASRRSTTLAALAHVHGKLGHLDESEHLMLEALSMARESADPLDETRVKINHASTLVDIYRHHELGSDTEQIQAVKERIRRQLTQLRPLIGRLDQLPVHYQRAVLIVSGTACIYVDDAVRAREWLGSAIASLDEHTDTQMRYHALLGMAELELRSGSAQACVEVLDRIMQGQAVLSQTQMMHEYHALASRAQLTLGETARADEHGVARAKLDDQRAAAQQAAEARLARWKWPFMPTDV